MRKVWAAAGVAKSKMAVSTARPRMREDGSYISIRGERKWVMGLLQRVVWREVAVSGAVRTDAIVHLGIVGRPRREAVDVPVERAECRRYQHGIVDLDRSEEHTSDLQSRANLVCRLLLD